MTDPNNALLPEELGRRLKLARNEAQLTQADAAKQVGFARTTLVAIEKGERQISSNELLRLVDLYGLRASTLLRQSAVHVDLVPRFRQFGRVANPGTDAAVNLLNRFVTAEVELEDLLGIARPDKLLDEKPILKGDVRAQGRADANAIRTQFGFGQRPIIDLFQFLEVDLGIRLYFHPLDGKVSGLFAYDAAVGACILINANHPYFRQVTTAAHEFAHIVSARHRPDICSAAYVNNSREERYATAFSAELLMPVSALAEHVKAVCAGSPNLTRRHIIILSHYFGVSREALVRQLEEHGLAHEGTWEWFRLRGGITNIQAKEVLGEAKYAIREARLNPVLASVRLDTLASQAFQRDLLSEGQVAELLDISRLEARRIRIASEEFGDAASELA